MQIEVVGVKFKHSNYTYKFSPNGKELNLGDKVIVDTERGFDLATVVEKEGVIDASLLTESLKNVVRVATKAEVENASENSKKAGEFTKEIKQMVKKMQLEMKVVSVDCNFDFSKLIINFTSEERVDFRALAKKIAEKFKLKVELRQIGPRDAVKILGGLGICGKECCCSQGYGDCDHVSIKMAKNQNLSLNPTSISGVCGKLLCCLSYENKNYVEMLKDMPRVNSFVGTPDGKGKVLFNNLFKKKVTVKIEKEKLTEIKEFDLEKIRFDKKV